MQRRGAPGTRRPGRWFSGDSSPVGAHHGLAKWTLLKSGLLSGVARGHVTAAGDCRYDDRLGVNSSNEVISPRYLVTPSHQFRQYSWEFARSVLGEASVRRIRIRGVDLGTTFWVRSVAVVCMKSHNLWRRSVNCSPSGAHYAAKCHFID